MSVAHLFLLSVLEAAGTYSIALLTIVFLLLVALGVYSLIRHQTIKNYRRMLYEDKATQLKKSIYLEHNFNDILVGFDKDVSLYYINIDNFKNYNDIFGIPAADRLLSVFAKRLRSVARSESYVYRIHSDRFILINPTEDDLDMTFSEKMLALLKEPYYSLDDHVIRLTVSVGRYDIKTVTPRYHDVLLRSELAHEKAQSSGKDQVIVFSKDLKEHHENTFEMYRFIKNTIQSEGFFLEFQPIVNAADSQIAGYEALLRYNDKHKLLFPSEIIAHAEKFNMIDEVDRIVVDRAFRAYRRFEQKGVPFEFLSINISSKEIHNRTFVPFIRDKLKEHDIDPRRIIIEFTETVDPLSTEEESYFIEQLRALKLKVAIDDFGTGYSSMRRLSKNKLDRIKIDRSFVTDVMRFKSKQSLVKAMVSIAAAFDLDVIVEGVETEAELDFMKKQKIKYIQGYLFYRSMDMEDVINKFSKP